MLNIYTQNVSDILTCGTLKNQSWLKKLKQWSEESNEVKNNGKIDGIKKSWFC